MEDKLNNFPEGTSRKAVIDELIDHDDVREIVLKQFNYMRINGINLVQDADDLVNLYLKIAKKFLHLVLQFGPALWCSITNYEK